MELLILASQIAGFSLLAFFINFQFKKFDKRISDNETSVKNIHKRIDDIFTVDVPAENEATKISSTDIEVTEENPIPLPKDVKFAIEGGDTQVPYGYKEKN